MSDHAVSTGHENQATQTAGAAPASPEFDDPEVQSFGQQDTHAVTVIGKMLAGFFFYSFLIMLAVAVWTMSRGGQVDPAASHAQHAEDADE